MKLLRTSNEEAAEHAASFSAASPPNVDGRDQSLDASADASETVKVLRDLAHRLGRIEQTLSVVMLIAARLTDITHVSVPEAARALGVSVKTVRRRIEAGSLKLETIPGTKHSGIPVDRLYDGWWLPLDIARSIVADERRDIDMLKRKNR